ncbi:hypothetical protein SeLEV6574_g05176 [Synchytrium endobioticum]|uniref:Uncharacterized protein n=1 Tax=Synchytrium endobioticum TaxID=286115 RepID=A0A507CVR0_9FUNG|nr:hypothetical protein SeLEV6574_g05176 [Synchytrium endobioticum]
MNKEYRRSISLQSPDSALNYMGKMSWPTSPFILVAVQRLFSSLILRTRRNEHIQESFAYFDGVTVESLYNLLENRRVGHFDGYDVPQAPLKKRSKDGPSLYSIGGSTPTESIQHHHPMMRLLPPGPDVFSGHQLAPIRLKFPLRSNNHGSRQ